MRFDYKQTIYSDGTDAFIKQKKNTLTVRLRVYKKNDIQNVFLCTIPEGERIFTRMKRLKPDAFFQYWQAKINIINLKINYKFFVTTENDAFWHSQTGVTSYIPPDLFDFKYIAGYKPVKWLKNSVFYHIFPDRFCDGNTKTNVKDNEYVYCNKPTKAMKWGQTSGKYKPKVHIEFCGGDLEGIKQKIPYLKSLGVNALYLTPVFLSPSPHKYDTQDYYKIDPHFGTNKEFAELVKLLHKNKIKIILDGVFNHCGASHYWFNKYGFYKTGGAYNDKNSPYYEFFKFYKHPRDYKCWLGVKTLPKLNYESEKLKDIIYRGKNSVAKYWLKAPYNIDGWRIDVANMTARMDEYQEHHAFWREFTQNVKSVNPQSYVMGEHFFDATDLLRGDMLDAVMNYYGFYFPVTAWFTNRYDFQEGKKSNCANMRYSTETLREALEVSRAQIPWQIQQQLYNLLNSHDTPRFYSLINKNKNMFKAAFVFLFTYLGTPGIFYGDEIGLGGENSIDCRRCMEWDDKKQDKGIYGIVKKLIPLRKETPALREGGIKILYAQGDVFAFARFAGKDCVISVINRGARQSVTLPLWQIGKISGGLKDIFSGRKFKTTGGKLKLNLGKQESLCLTLK